MQQLACTHPAAHLRHVCGNQEQALVARQALTVSLSAAPLPLRLALLHVAAGQLPVLY